MAVKPGRSSWRVYSLGGNLMDKLEKRQMERLINSMKLFFLDRERDGVTFRNDELPPRQRARMKSILKQARRIKWTGD